MQNPRSSKKPSHPNPSQLKKTADISEDKKWVNQLSDSNWVLQHAALETLEEAKAFQQASSNYKDAKILFSPRKGKKMYYIVLTGPFESRQAAQTVMQSNPALSKAWMRSGKSLKNQFQE
ncbi:MAG: SPOR domain-containing protein [Actinobacteria bacterium]|nr:SPOR domain-containing protein [Actinomycetota bacterium]